MLFMVTPSVHYVQYIHKSYLICVLVLRLHNLSNGVEEAPHPRINVIAEAEINTTQIPNASEAKF
jgi:hypothetical protein